jgi:hypothetical protein
MSGRGVQLPVWGGLVDRRRIPTSTLGAALLCAASSALVGVLVVSPGNIRTAVAIGVAVSLAGLAMVSRTYLLLALIVWLAALGLVRRLMTGLDPVRGFDPLLLVGPVSFLVLVALAWNMGAFRNRSALANAVLALGIIAAISAVNPLQGSLATGGAGLLFVLVPMAGFWIGRAFGRRAVSAALWVVAALAIPAAIYGIYQVVDSFPSWDERWIATTEYFSLYVDGVVRPFSAFSAAAEYTFFLGCAVVVWIALGMRSRRVVLVVPVLALLATGIWLAGTRTVVVTLLASLVLMWAAHRRWRLGGALVAVVAMAAVLPAIVGLIASPGSNGGSPSALSQHQLSGISNPLNPDDSTLIVHAELVRDGLLSAVSTPFGHGAGSVTIAAEKFGGASKNTEGDPSNAAVAFGLPGLIAFALILVLGYRRVYGLAAATRDPLAIAALGIITVTLFAWLNGGQYAVAFLPWLMLGWADRQSEAPQ